MPCDVHVLGGGRAARRDWTSPDADATPSSGFFFLSRKPSGRRSQVLIGVVLALAVRGRSQERQLFLAATAILVNALQLQYPTTEVQAALEVQESLEAQAQLERLILFDIS